MSAASVLWLVVAVLSAVAAGALARKILLSDRTTREKVASVGGIVVFGTLAAAAVERVGDEFTYRLPLYIVGLCLLIWGLWRA